MSQYTPTSGTILQINHNHINASQYGCELTLTLQSMDQGIVNIAISGSTYVFNHHPLKVGDSVTCFYSLLAPVPLIYPPLYSESFPSDPDSASQWPALLWGAF